MSYLNFLSPVRAAQATSVSILVLMDVVLKHNAFALSTDTLKVSILVLMDVVLKHIA